jgi:hypothetical protein
MQSTEQTPPTKVTSKVTSRDKRGSASYSATSGEMKGRDAMEILRAGGSLRC